MPSILTRCFLPALLVLPALARSQVLDRAGVQGLATRYASAEHWALRALVLLALGSKWHPDGAAMVAGALHDKDRRLQVFGLEALRRTERQHLPVVLTKPVIDELVHHQLKHKSALHRARVLEVLAPIAPAVNDRTQAGFASWWYQAQKDYAPAAWVDEAPAPRGAERTVAGLVERAFDLNASGLEVAIVIDATGSMQPTIDSARAALEELVTLLHGIAPKLRLGVVQYRDFDVSSAGAEVVAPLSANVDDVIEKLGTLRAAGGGDTPERVEKGLALALDPSLGWSRLTNKLLVVIGDAPPHPEDQDLCKELVQRAREHPFAKGPVTGAKAKDVRAFVTSTIAIRPAAAPAFRAIAEAGGGMFTQIAVNQKGGNDDAVAKLSQHVLTLCFGSRFANEIKAFVVVFREYEKDGFFK